MATSLADQHCVVCRPGTPPLVEDEIDRLLPEVERWTVAETFDRHLVLNRTFRFKGFMPGVEFVNGIARIAEDEGHHPDLQLSYGRLIVELWTHAAGGLTQNDFVLAAKIDRLDPR
jgi:4a-hydroxytetrahydrobiopterin dehydratase